jgi:aspartate aminotransferase
MTTTAVASTLVRSLARRVIVAQRGGATATATALQATRRCLATTTTTSPWAPYEMGPLDPIIGLNETFSKDDFPLKQIVGVGAYRDGAGKPYMLPCVRKAEKLLYDQHLVSVTCLLQL